MAIPTASIRTARLDLVPLRVEDAAEMVHVLADPALYGFVGGGPPVLAELVGRYQAQVAGRSADGHEAWHNWIVRERSSGAATGFVQATVTGTVGSLDGPAVAEVAWLIGGPWQRRGYGGEAAAGLVAWLLAAGVASIVAHVHPDHAASAAVAARAGLVATEAFRDGERVWRRDRVGAGPTPDDPTRSGGPDDPTGPTLTTDGPG